MWKRVLEQSSGAAHNAHEVVLHDWNLGCSSARSQGPLSAVLHGSVVSLICASRVVLAPTEDRSIVFKVAFFRKYIIFLVVGFGALAGEEAPRRNPSSMC